MSRECPVCRHALQASLIRHVQSWEDKVAVFENVPADVCGNCGETLFSGEVVDKLNQLLWSMPPAERTIEAPVYDLSAA